MIKIIYTYIFLLIFNCASQGLPQGGPEDSRGPILLSVNPLNKNDINAYDKIILEFDERIEPNSIFNSIFINPEIDVSTKVKGNKIIIKPLAQWPKEEPIEINLNRGISDFQANNISEEIQLIYNIKDDEYFSIQGQLFNANKKLHNIYVYKWLSEESISIIENSSPIKKVNSDLNNHFFIDYLKPGKYIVIASEGNLNIHNNRYGITPFEYIDLNSHNSNQDFSIYIDEPLEKRKITRVETINSRLLNISYDDNTVEPYYLESAITDRDSIYINIKTNNRLQKYEIEPYLHLGKNILDTIPPFIVFADILDTSIIVNFSEPINKDSLFVMGKNTKLRKVSAAQGISVDENNWSKIKFKNINPMSIELYDSKFNEIKFLGSSIEDFSQNKMLDSVKVYTINLKSTVYKNGLVNKGVSSLKGKIINPIKKNIIVEAKNISLSSLNLSYVDLAQDSLFVFKDLHPGKYVFRAYEKKNEINPLIYFSGTLTPYQSAAKFSIYQDTIEVRKFWDIEGINIEF